MAGKKKRRSKKRIVIVTLSVLALLSAAGIALAAPVLSKVMKLQREAESIVSQSTVTTFKSSKTTIIYDIRGNELCKMKNIKDLYYIDYDQIPKEIEKAFIISEDKKFYDHNGIDVKSIFRAVIENLKSDNISQGASTITQQLARNMFLTQEVTWNRKIAEIFIAIELEKKYTKEQILEFYINNIYFANGYYGIEAAARGYFSKTVNELTLSEKVFLCAIPNSPTRYDPIENYANTVTRRNLLLDQMYADEAVNTMEYYAALEEEIIINQPQIVRNNYVETYVRRCATESMMRAFGFTFRYDFVSEEDYTEYREQYDDTYALYQQKLLNGGYSVYTSIDLDVQTQLQKAVDENLSGFEGMNEEGVFELQGAATCIDNQTGNVVAIVGGRSQDFPGYTLNRAYQSYRQPGSSIKPLIVYTPFLQLGNNPDTVVEDVYAEGLPRNADGSYLGSISLRDAVRYSKNTVAWKLYEQLTPKAGSSHLLKMQFKRIYMDQEYVSGALGGFTYGVTTEEMAGAYAALVNDGVYRRTTCILSIKDPADRIIVDEIYRDINIYDANAARMMTDMLKTVVQSGTGTAANINNAIVAGKTGTTNDDKDSWFSGYSKYYTTAVWMGYDMPKTISSPGRYTSAIWKQFMTAIHQDLPVIDFPAYYKPQEEETQKETESQTPEETEPQTEQYSGQTGTGETKSAVSGEEDATIDGLGDQDATLPFQND